MDHEYKIDDGLEQQMKRLLSDIAKEPISDEVRALAEQLQKLLNERHDAAQTNG